MRLLNSTTLALYEFADDEIPEYAILSHRWGKDEVSFQDIQTGRAKAKTGYSKLEGCAKQATADGCDYFWIDTCCIDKGSSAELSEAINSMFQWYRDAKVCYAYLSDVSSPWLEEAEEAFQKSEWHTRGWTLQELIAPYDVVFYSQNWESLGTKRSLSELISNITNVDPDILLGAEELKDVSVSRRMSWAANRYTTRREDVAYCLMGIFDVNMPLLYGEGDKAFIRLQAEIMKDSDDHTLFTWRDDDNEDDDDDEVEHPVRSGLLASSPSQFRDSQRFKAYRNWNVTLPYSLTNKGLSMQLVVARAKGEENISLAILDCQVGDDIARRPAIYLECLSAEGNQFARIKSNEIRVLEPSAVAKGKLTPVYIRQQTTLPVAQKRKSNDTYEFYISRRRATSAFPIRSVTPGELWDPKNQILRLSKRENSVGCVRFAGTEKCKEFCVLLGVVKKGSERGVQGPWCKISETGSLSEDVPYYQTKITHGMYIGINMYVTVTLLPIVVFGNELLEVQVSVDKRRPASTN